MVQIFFPLTFVPVFGSERIVWLPLLMFGIFLIDRKLDGRYGVLIPVKPEEETKANKACEATGDNVSS
jgi:hypothetical protein